MNGHVGHVCEIISSPGDDGTSFCPDGNAVASCPATNRLGTCYESAFGGDELVTTTTIYYADGWPTAADAEAQCTSVMGKWTPGG